MQSFVHWPLEKVRANLAKRLEASAGAAASATFYVILTTGAMNPVHNGHLFALHAAAAALEQRGMPIVGAFLSPSSDVYLRGKFPPGGSDFLLPAATRHAACVRATSSDALVAVGGYEVSHWDRWPDFPEVCADLQQALNAAFAPSNQIKVIYSCGSDHYFKCALWRGVRLGGQLGTALVACTTRAGDEQRLQDPAYASSQFAVVLPALEGPLASLSSTKIREALKLLGTAMHPDALVDVVAKLSGQ